MRVVPRQNEAINECWIADRDRYSYEGIYSADRLDGADGAQRGWRVEASRLGDSARSRGQRPEGRRRRARDPGERRSRPLEEYYLLQRLARALGLAQHRSSPAPGGFPRQAADPAVPALGGSPSPTVDYLEALLVVGSNLRREAPVLAHRVRKAAKRGAKVCFLNPAQFEYLFPVAGLSRVVARDAAGRAHCRLLAVLDGAAAPAHLASLAASAEVNTAHRGIAAALKAAEARHLARRAGTASSGSMPICAPWPRVSRQPPAPRSASSPKAAMPPARIWPACCRIAIRVASGQRGKPA